jgi:hypothetical protein
VKSMGLSRVLVLLMHDKSLTYTEIWRICTVSGFCPTKK